MPNTHWHQNVKGHHPQFYDLFPDLYPRHNDTGGNLYSECFKKTVISLYFLRGQGTTFTQDMVGIDFYKHESRCSGFQKNQMRTEGAICTQPLLQDLTLTISKKNTDLVKKAIGVSFMKKKW